MPEGPSRRVSWWWTILGSLLFVAAVVATLVPTSPCLSCERHERETGHMEITFVLTTHGCYGVGWEGCPDCRGRMKVPLATWALRRASP